MQFCAPDDGRKPRLKHAERLTEINKLRNVAPCWLYSENTLAMHGPMNVKYLYFIWPISVVLRRINRLKQ